LAGAGFKLFQNGDVLLSSEVNQFMMEQQIMVFADATARGTALPTPSHGMFSFTKDDDRLAYFDGSVWRNV
jgi:hypothetical protein